MAKGKHKSQQQEREGRAAYLTSSKKSRKQGKPGKKKKGKGKIKKGKGKQ